VQVEIPIESEHQQSPQNSSVMDTTTTGYLAHQSMTSSQTITTIASINNRASDVEGGSDVTSLIRPEIVGIHIALNSGNNCNGRANSRFSNDSSSRCTSSSDRHNGSIFIKESHDHHHQQQQQQHDTSDASECKNVYNSTELNKVPMSTYSHLSTRSLTLPRNVHARASFLPLDRCEETGIR
jgi:hypothetical protein